MRTCAQLVSYEVSLALSVLGVVIMAGTLSLTDIVSAQSDTVWYAVPQIVGLIVFLFAGTAETARAPFDLPEAEQELVAGYHTEYGGMRYGLYAMSEYVNLITLSALCVTLFLGGWHGPGLGRCDVGRAAVVHRQADPSPVRVHLDADDASPPALRPADALRLEGAPPRRDRQRRRDRDPGGGALDGPAVLDAQGLRCHVPADLPEADHAAVPGVQAPRLPALPRPPPPAHARERAREVRRLLAVRRRVPGGLHPRRRRGEHAPRTGCPPASATRASTRST